jgi:phospholipid/cholesterol/gamma-HCH transport system substrate-binding protein
VCQVINTIPSLPTGGTGVPTLTLPTSIIPTILAAPGARRVAFGPRGPNMRQLTRMYDPGLVSLLVPGLVMSP